MGSEGWSSSKEGQVGNQAMVRNLDLMLRGMVRHGRVKQNK